MGLFKRKAKIKKIIMLVDACTLPTGKTLKSENGKWDIIRQDKHKFIWTLNENTNTGMQNDRNMYVESMTNAILNSKCEKIMVIMDLNNIGEAEEAILSIINDFKEITIYWNETENYLKKYYITHRFATSKHHAIRFKDTMCDALQILNIRIK